MEVKAIYFDMDGVLADFAGGAEALAGVKAPRQEDATEESDRLLWDGIRGVDRFYDRLAPLPGAVELFRALRARYGDLVQILTGIPKPKRRIPRAAEDKTAWAHRLLDPGVTVNVVFKAQKKEFCTGRDCILIDDLSDTIRDWNALGGTGILHVSVKDTKAQLHRLGIL